MSHPSTLELVGQCTSALQRLRAASGVVVGTHLGPDADGIGSSLALARGLRGIGVPAWVALEEPLDARNAFFARGIEPSGLESLLLVGDAVHELGGRADLCVVVDTGRVPHQSCLREFTRKRRIPVLVVDHHLHSGTPDADIVVVSSASSAEVVYAILCALEAPTDALGAQWLYTATSYDTGSFRFLRDGAATLRLAAEWVECGADPVQAQIDLYQNASWGGRQFLASALTQSRRDFDGQLAWVALHPIHWDGFEVDRDDFRDLIQELISVRDVKVAATLIAVPEEKRIRLSFRARPGYNIEPLARKYGGGGHAQACGATVKGMDLDGWATKVRHALGRILERGPDQGTRI